MKINELRTMIKPYDKNKLSYIIAELYKVIPKAVKEDRSVDDIIKNPVKTTKKIGLGKKLAMPDIDDLEDEINEFCINAKAQLYFAPNRTIPKKKRSGWRFIVKRFYDDLMLAAGKQENMEQAANLLEELYKVLSYGSGYHIFATTDTFRAIKVPQEKFLKNILLLNQQLMVDSDFARKMVDIVSDNEPDNETSFDTLHEMVLESIKSSAARKLMLETCLEKITKTIAAPAKKAWSNDEYSKTYKINHLAKFALRLAIENSEPEVGIKLFKKYYNRNESLGEMTLYVLLSILLEYKLSDLIVREYELALKKKISPRNGLKVLYAAAKNNDLPNYMPPNH